MIVSGCTASIRARSVAANALFEPIPQVELERT
jgi:hypothetical protein